MILHKYISTGTYACGLSIYLVVTVVLVSRGGVAEEVSAVISAAAAVQVVSHILQVV